MPSYSNPNHFFGEKRLSAQIATKGVAQRRNLWYPGTTIRVKFLNDPDNRSQEVITWAKEWEQYAGITFQFVTEGNADVRIGFDWNDERYITWSYIGTDCKQNTDQNDATMSFAFFDEFSTQRDRRADVLRAFGSVLGLELEHRHLSFNPGWTTRIASFWEGEVEDIPWASLKQYVFDPLDAAGVIQTATYDPNSIMIWPFLSRFASNTSRDFNYELSDMDKAFIKELYPKADYYNGYQHDLPEPNWEQLKLITGKIGGTRDKDGNYYFYPYHGGNIVKYNSALTSSSVLGMAVSIDYRSSPIIIPTSNGDILARKSYIPSQNTGAECINLDNPSSEHTNTTLSTSSFGGFNYDYTRNTLYHNHYLLDNEFNLLNTFDVTGEEQLVFWGKKYKWIAKVNGLQDNPVYYVYEQPNSSNFNSRENLVATINVPGFRLWNGAYSTIYEYNNKLVITNLVAGSILILDPTGNMGSMYKIYTPGQATWRSGYGSQMICGGFYWKNKLMVYTHDYERYYYEFPELLIP